MIFNLTSKSQHTCHIPYSSKFPQQKIFIIFVIKLSLRKYYLRKFDKATPNIFPVFRPPPASVSCQHQIPLFPYSSITYGFSRILWWNKQALVNFITQHLHRLFLRVLLPKIQEGTLKRLYCNIGSDRKYSKSCITQFLIHLK